MATDPEYMPSDDNSEDPVETVEATPSTLAIINQSEHAAMVATANIERNRRNLDVFSKKLMQYATHSQPVALSMFYSLPRANKQIVGPSVRYAEVVAPCWRNNSTGSRVVGATDATVTAQGVFIDYESNQRNVKEIPRRITDSQGRKFNDDMILTTSKAALSIAYREAILKGGVPQALWDPGFQAAKETAVGKAMSHSQRVDTALEYLMKLGVTEWQIMNSVGVSSPKEIEMDHLVTLRVLCEEIKKGEKSIESVFGSQYDKEIEALFVQLKKNEAERTLLRRSYMGRAKDLLEYLKGRLAPSTQHGQQASTETEKAKEEAPKTTEEKPAASGKKKANGKAEKPPAATTEAPATQETAQQEEKKPDPQPETQQGGVQEGMLNF